MLARGELIGETSPTIAGSDVQEQVLGKKYQVSRRLLTLYSPQVPKKPLKRTDGRRTVHETPVGLLGQRLSPPNSYDAAVHSGRGQEHFGSRPSVGTLRDLSPNKQTNLSWWIVDFSAPESQSRGDCIPGKSLEGHLSKAHELGWL
jgi:hypothetical protein